MTERERMEDRLLSLLYSLEDARIDTIAGCILRDGWIRPPCKVGDKLYIIADVSKEIVDSTIIGFWLFDNTLTVITEAGTIHNDSIGKTVFFTREEAEQALKERENKE